MALQNGQDEVARLLKGKLTEPRQSGEHLCIVCMDSGTEVVLIPCGHRNLCGVCAYRWAEENNGCPIDRMWVSEIVPLKRGEAAEESQEADAVAEVPVEEEAEQENEADDAPVELPRFSSVHG